MLAGAPAPDVHVVADVREVAGEPFLVVEGRDEEDVVEVARLAVGIVDHQHVAGREVLGTVLRHRPRHEPADGHEVRRLAEGPAPPSRPAGVHEGTGIVEVGS